MHKIWTPLFALMIIFNGSSMAGEKVHKLPYEKEFSFDQMNGKVEFKIRVTEDDSYEFYATFYKERPNKFSHFLDGPFDKEKHDAFNKILRLERGEKGFLVDKGAPVNFEIKVYDLPSMNLLYEHSTETPETNTSYMGRMASIGWMPLKKGKNYQVELNYHLLDPNIQFLNPSIKVYKTQRAK